MIIALYNIDIIINLIKNSKSVFEIKKSLLLFSFNKKIDFFNKNDEYCNRFEKIYFFSEKQVIAILNLNLQFLLKMEINKLFLEYNFINEKVKIYNNILLDYYMINEIIKLELLLLQKEFFDIRKTFIVNEDKIFCKENSIIKDNVVVTLSKAGYIKSQLLSLYKVQHRGGKGKIATSIREEDFLTNLFVLTTHDILLCFSSKGKVYNLKVVDISISTRISKGKPIINLLPLEKNETISTILSINNFKNDQMIFMCTKNGMVKKILIKEFNNIRSSGIISINLKNDDVLIGVEIINKDEEVMLFTSYGKAIRFNSSLVKCTGRLSIGIRGIKLINKDFVISLVVIKDGGSILLGTTNGYGKRTDFNEFKSVLTRGHGIISIQISKRNGFLVSAIQVFNNNDVMLISCQGLLVRIKSDEISKIKRNTQGMKLINLISGEKLVAIKSVDYML